MLRPVRALVWIATDAACEINEIDEFVCLAPQRVGNHGRSRRDRRNHRNSHSLALNCLDK